MLVLHVFEPARVPFIPAAHPFLSALVSGGAARANVSSVLPARSTKPLLGMFGARALVCGPCDEMVNRSLIVEVRLAFLGRSGVFTFVSNLDIDELVSELSEELLRVHLCGITMRRLIEKVRIGEYHIKDTKVYSVAQLFVRKCLSIPHSARMRLCPSILLAELK